MNNPKGETRFESNGKGYILKFTFNSFCQLEDAFGISINSILKQLEADSKGGDFKFKDLRTMMRCGLSHADPEINNEKAGKIIEGLPDFKDAFGLISDAFIDGFGGDDKGSKKAGGTPAETS